MEKETCQQFRGAIINGDLKKLSRLLSANAESFDEGLVADAACSTPAIVQALLDAGWDVNAREDRSDMTLLMFAAAKGKADVVDLLLARGADPHATDSGGLNAVISACSGKSKGHEQALESLLSAGASLRIEPPAATPLMVAVADGTAKMASQLLNAGCPISEEVNNYYGTALAGAIRENRAEMAPLLLEHGADPNHRFPEDFNYAELAGKTELEIARALGRKKIVKIIEQFLEGESSDDDCPSVTEAWRRLHQTLLEAGENIDECFLRPATAVELRTLEEQFAIPAPDDLKESLAFCNGQPELAMYFGLADGVFGLEGPNLFRVLSVEEMLGEREAMLRFIEEGVFEGGEPSVERGVRATFWDERWLPIARNYVGNLLAYDFHPDDGGRVGQIIHYNHETWSYTIAANGLAELLSGFEVVTFEDDE